MELAILYKMTIALSTLPKAKEMVFSSKICFAKQLQYSIVLRIGYTSLFVYVEHQCKTINDY